tara:strand:- start:296 stop:469 length:174 start_codon:yes stop_codon:yes gene_type:complete
MATKINGIIHSAKFNFSSRKILSEFGYFEKYDRKSSSNFENLIILVKFVKLYLKFIP